MKTSDKPTADILIKASTNSEWDCCEFAFIQKNGGNYRQKDLKPLSLSRMIIASSQ